jgi:hypothetical protein
MNTNRSTTGSKMVVIISIVCFTLLVLAATGVWVYVQQQQTSQWDRELQQERQLPFKSILNAWTAVQLRDELAARGVTALPRPNKPARPLAQSHIHTILKNRRFPLSARPACARRSRWALA